MKQKEIAFFTQRIKWKMKENHIYKKYKLKDFIAVKNFFNRIADASERQNHHPKVIITYNELEVFLSTYDVDGITEKDFRLASSINQIFDEFKK